MPRLARIRAKNENVPSKAAPSLGNASESARRDSRVPIAETGRSGLTASSWARSPESNAAGRPSVRTMRYPDDRL